MIYVIIVGAILSLIVLGFGVAVMIDVLSFDFKRKEEEQHEDSL